MRLTLIISLLTTACLTVPAAAQNPRVVGNKNGERAATTQLLFGTNVAGGMSIEYGQPIWKADHEKMREQLKGKLLRLGKDWWTTMTTSFPLEVGGTKVPAGSYLLGLHCDKDGKFSLTFLEATKGMQAGALPFEMGGNMNWKPDYMAPLTMNENATDEAVEKMKMTLSIDGSTLSGTYTLAWGPHELSTEVAVKIGKKTVDGDEEEVDEAEEHGKEKAKEKGKKGEHE